MRAPWSIGVSWLVFFSGCVSSPAATNPNDVETFPTREEVEFAIEVVAESYYPSIWFVNTTDKIQGCLVKDPFGDTYDHFVRIHEMSAKEFPWSYVLELDLPNRAPTGEYEIQACLNDDRNSTNADLGLVYNHSDSTVVDVDVSLLSRGKFHNPYEEQFWRQSIIARTGAGFEGDLAEFVQGLEIFLVDNLSAPWTVKVDSVPCWDDGYQFIGISFESENFQSESGESNVYRGNKETSCSYQVEIVEEPVWPIGAKNKYNNDDLSYSVPGYWIETPDGQVLKYSDVG